MSLLQSFAQNFTTLDNSNTNEFSFNASSTGGTDFILVALLVSLVVYGLMGYLIYRIFKKTDTDNPWAAWVPFYSQWKMLELGGQKGYWAVLSIIPVVNIVSLVFTYIAMYNIGKNFGKPDAFVVLAILLPLAWYIWLAFDKSTWKYAPNETTTPTVEVGPNPQFNPADTNQATDSVEPSPVTAPSFTATTDSAQTVESTSQVVEPVPTLAAAPGAAQTEYAAPAPIEPQVVSPVEVPAEQVIATEQPDSQDQTVAFDNPDQTTQLDDQSPEEDKPYTPPAGPIV